MANLLETPDIEAPVVFQDRAGRKATGNNSSSIAGGCYDGPGAGGG